MSVHPFPRNVPGRCQGHVTDLVLRCGLGDEVALGELFDLTHRLVGAIVCKGGPPSAATDDLVVAVFVQIWHEAAGYDPDDPASPGVVAWLGEQATAVAGTPAARRPPVVLAG